MDQRTVDAYNQLALAYDQETTVFWDLFPPTFLQAFVQQSGRRVLDIGSGPGRDGLFLQRAGKEVTCLDASETMVQLSSSRGLRSVLADFDALPFAPHAFDGVWAYTSLLHIPKNRIAVPLEETARVLAPGGAFALGLIEGETEGYRESSGMRLPRWFSFYKKEEVERAVAAHGFDLVSCETFKPRSKNYLHFLFRKR